MQTFQNYIAGEWVDATSQATFENRNPADTTDVIGTFPLATVEDVERAIESANSALPTWAALPPPARGVILDKVAQVLEARQDEFAKALTREEGKTLSEAKGEVLDRKSTRLNSSH